MKVTFLGAAGEVTGSAYLIETDRTRVLLDFGLHQGEREAAEHNKMPAQLDAARLDAVVLTHAHIDHCGRLPMLIPAGFHGPVFATPATIELTEILLRDTARLQEQDAARANSRAGEEVVELAKPLYGIPEVEGLLPLFRGLPYKRPQEVAPGIAIRFFDAGHILGSASVEMTVEERGRRRIIVFSGDIGPRGVPLIFDPTLFTQADVAFLESTYGDRDHRSREETVAEFNSILADARTTSGKVLVPAFAVGRTQDLIYEMARAHCAGRMNNAAVYVDSPMAIDVTDLYRRHTELWDEQATAMKVHGCTPLNFPGLRFARTVDESKQLNFLNHGTVIIAGSGMCTGGRIVHHLRLNLEKPETRVVIVGFQAEGTLGRRLVDGQKHVRILGQEVQVHASIHTLGGFSAHAGQSGLLEWARSFSPKPERLILTHGEPTARNALRYKLKTELAIDAERPLMFDTYDL
jgi:metallo-beta-lactamase family protein